MRQLVIMIAMKTRKAFITALSQLPLDVNLNELGGNQLIRNPRV